MKLISRHWSKIYPSNPKNWNRDILKLCTADELEALCRLMGVPHSGTKTVKITRLLNMTALRMELSTWGEYQDSNSTKAQEKAHKIATDICASYKRLELIALAKMAKSFYSLPKRGIVIGLLQWRDRCRTKGQKFNNEIKQAVNL